MVTSSQQASITLLQIKQQIDIFDQEIKQEKLDCSMSEFDSCQPSTDGAAIVDEISTDIITNKLTVDNSESTCLAQKYDEPNSALHLAMVEPERTTVPFEEVLISEVQMEEISIKLEQGEEMPICLPQNAVTTMVY
ncbi:hypothetical protein B566_EDAN016990 [Ephemera danica]|nr:hypothetical protein B566_EDAN016990 [Ephemera danica]